MGWGLVECLMELLTRRLWHLHPILECLGYSSIQASKKCVSLREVDVGSHTVPGFLPHMWEIQSEYLLLASP